MLKLSDREWKEFTFNDLFLVRRGESLYKQYMERGNIPYISASSANNGVSDYTKTANRAGNMLSLAYDGSVGSVFYQSSDWFASEKIVSIELKDRAFSRELALFFARVIEHQKTKYNYGYKWSVGIRMMRGKIRIPITQKGKPDYDFMEQYIKEREALKRQEYITYCRKKLENRRVNNPLRITDIKYNEFKLIDLFEHNRGNQNKMNSLTDGEYPLISAKNINNGLKAFVEENSKSYYNGNSISLNNDGDGGVGIAYYQPHDYYLDSHCTALYPKNTNSNLVMLFLSASITKQRCLFSHGHSISEKRLKKITIMLPATDNGQPDYAFMEQYAKNIMLKRYNSYLEYCNRNYDVSMQTQ